MKRLHAIYVGLMALLLAGELSSGWAGCAVSVTGAASGDQFVAVVGGNGVVMYSFFDTNGDCTDNPFDTDGDGQDCAAEGSADAHSSVLPFSPTGSGELSQNIDRDATGIGNRWPGTAGTGEPNPWEPVPGSPKFATGADVTCSPRADGSETEIAIIGLNGLGSVSECVFDLDGNQTFIQTKMNSATGGDGDLDDDGWLGLSTASPCRVIE